MVGSSLDDLGKTRLEQYFSRRFPDWSTPEDWASTLAAHKLAAISEVGATPTHLGILLFAKQPEQYISGAYIDLAVYNHDIPDGNTVDSRQITGPFQNPGALYNTLTIENLYAGCQPARRNQFLTGFMRYYESPVTGSSFLEARGEGFLNLVRDSQRLSGRRPKLEQIGAATKLTIYAAQYPELA